MTKTQQIEALYALVVGLMKEIPMCAEADCSNPATCVTGDFLGYENCELRCDEHQKYVVSRLPKRFGSAHPEESERAP